MTHHNIATKVNSTLLILAQHQLSTSQAETGLTTDRSHTVEKEKKSIYSESTVCIRNQSNVCRARISMHGLLWYKASLDSVCSGHQACYNVREQEAYPQRDHALSIFRSFG